MLRSIPTVLAALVGVAPLTACYVSTGPPVYTEEVVVVEQNVPPYVNWAQGGCYFDGYYYDDIWYFEADVDDANSPYDVTFVYADVYDDYTGAFVDTFELFPTDNPYLWFSDWLGATTYLDCAYSGYSVDIVAYDSYDAVDIITIYPQTHALY